MSTNKDQIEIEFIHDTTCYSKIYREFIVNNKPCVLSKNCTESWLCRKLWLNEDGRPNWDYIKLHYGIVLLHLLSNDHNSILSVWFSGEALVPVANCNVNHYNSHLKENWKLNKYIDYLIKYERDGYPISMKCLYMKVTYAHCIVLSLDINLYLLKGLAFL